MFEFSNVKAAENALEYHFGSLPNSYALALTVFDGNPELRVLNLKDGKSCLYDIEAMREVRGNRLRELKLDTDKFFQDRAVHEAVLILRKWNEYNFRDELIRYGNEDGKYLRTGSFPISQKVKEARRVLSEWEKIKGSSHGTTNKQ